MAVRGDVFADVDQHAVARAYDEARLRRWCAMPSRPREHGRQHARSATLHPVDEPGARLHVMLKGGGSDNASRVVAAGSGCRQAGIADELEEPLT